MPQGRIPPSRRKREGIIHGQDEAGAAQTKMKQFLIWLVRIYLGLGAVFGGLGILSYVWALATYADCGVFVLVVGALLYAVFGAAVRTLVWLPSLIHWWAAGPEPTFVQWLMPGLSIACGTSP